MMNDPTLERDLKRIAEDITLGECSVLVTGATGFIGSLLVKSLQHRNRHYHSGIQIIAHCRDKVKADRMFPDNGDLRFVYGDIADSFVVDKPVDYIIHCAANTASRAFVETPADTVNGIVLGTRNILELARLKSIKSLVFLSSMEVYGRTDPSLEWVTESDIGYIDPLSARSSYPMAKRMAETLCYSYFTQFGVPVKIARLARTFGAGLPEPDERVFCQFAMSVIRARNIALHTPARTMGNQCYSADTARALFLLLTDGADGEAYNVTNEACTISIRDMAELVAREVSGGKISVELDIPDDVGKYGYAPETRTRLSAQKLRVLGWKPEIEIGGMYQRMIESFGSRGIR